MTLTPSVSSAERLLELARAARLKRSSVAAPIEPADRGGRLPLSFAQQRLWFLEQLGGLGDTYHVSTRLRLGGELDRAALRRALDAILARHEALRTTFVEVEGEPVQRIAEESRFHLVEHDLGDHPHPAAELRRLSAEEAGTLFDLEHGPLIRGRLLRLGHDQHLLLLTMHHIVSDGWSMGVLTRELGALYDAFRRGAENPLPPLPIQYADYAIWQRKWVDGEVLRQQAEYWKTALAGAPELLELPTDRPRPARQDHAGGMVGIDLGEELTAGLKALSEARGTTLFMTVLAGWAAVLARLSGQDDVVVGTPSANRGRAEIEGLIGFFINTLALRVDLSGSPTVADLLARVKARALGAQHHQDIPFEQVVELVQPVRSLAHSPLFQVMFAWQNASESRQELPDPRPADTGPAGAASQVAAKSDLSLILGEAGGRIVGGMTYATALFEQATVERHLAYLRRVLEAFVADDLQRVDALPLLPEAERRQVMEEWSRREAAVPPEQCIHELFEAQAARTPGAVALVWENGEVTYGELNARANRLAHHLRALGVGPEARVAVCVERGPQMVAGMLAVLKAGGAYLPLDPAYPEDRLRYMLDDGAPAAVLTESALRHLFADAALPVVELGAPRPAWADEPETNPERGALSPANLAYVIYTSGSTGRPKGVRVAHANLAATLAVARDAFAFGPGDRVPSLASFAFDIWLFETLLPLLGGGTVRLVPRDRVLDVPRLVEDLAWCTTLHAVPALMRRIVEEVRARPGGVLHSLRHAFVGGDAVAPDLLEEMRVAFPAAEVHVLYGPTEATIICASHRLGGETAARQMVGRPLGNAALYVLEPGGQLAPAGVPGELCLGGASVARDYLGRPGLTAERFVPDPFATEPGARLYRTGDRVRWVEVRECESAKVRKSEGDDDSHETDPTLALSHSRTFALEFLGRTDRQVKVRGFRIEPGEIEARLREHPGVSDAVVLVREDMPGEKRLVAYVAGEAEVDAEALRLHLSEQLPEYMVPAAYVRLDAFPLTPTGKVDRKALPAPEGGAFVTRGYEAPVGETEAALAGVWAELLGVEQVGRRDHFFELGGHSLLAVRVISRVRQVLGAEVGIGDLFERPVLADLARAIENAARTELPPIEPADRSAPLPLSFAQQRLWFLEQVGDLGSAYHMSTWLRLGRELDGAALRRALDALLARHEALRTTFGMVDGEPVQRIAMESRFHLVEHDLDGHADAAAELRRLAAEEAGAPFDLEQGPLIRGRLVRAADDHVLLVTMHHIVSDGWSMGVLTRELGTLYDAFRRGEANPLLPLAVQYADYAAWQRRWVTGEVLRQQADYWKETLSGAPGLLELPADHPRPARQSHAGAVAGLELDEALTAGLKALGRRHGTTLFMTVLAGWAAVLARLSGRHDVVVGTPSANRGQAEIEGLIGFFVNTLALRVDLSGSPTVAEALARVKARALGAQANQDIPFEQVVELVQPVRSLAHTPLFQVMFTLQNAPEGSGTPRPEAEAGGASDGDGAAAASWEVQAKFDLSLSLHETGSRIVGGVTYAAALFERATVERWVGYLRRVLEEMAADDSRRVERLPLLPDAERHRVVEAWNATDAAFPSDLCIHELVEAQADRAPNAVAVVHESERVTYARLNARANQLAHGLRALGVGPDARVAISVDRGVEMMVGLLATLKAGGAYVPLDPAHPAERLTAMVADSAPAVLLTQGSLAGVFEGAGVRVIDLVADAGTWAREPETNPGVGSIGLTPDHLAYVIYTSGSTGTPKGVMVEHRSLANLVAWHRAAFGVKAGDRSSSVAGFGFDATTWEVWPPLCAGAALLLPATRDPEALLEWWEGQTLDVSFLPTPLAEVAFARGRSSAGLRTLLVGGDRLRSVPAELPFTLVNNYGPTETTVVATSGEVGAEAKVHIGRPIANTRVYLLDGAGEPVPVGVAGELYVGGAGVARGYQHRPGLTAERFVPDPFAGAPGARLYRTGDLARWLVDGTIEFLGRTDFQVKIRGFRIELGEIEARLAEHPAVRDAVVLVRQDAPGDGRLVAYYLGEALDVETLRAHLAQRLPSYMVPAAFVWMEAYPLTPNGKVDRKALPAPEGDAYAARDYEPPVGETEEALAEVWSELLGVERVGRRDHFFELGGHSLLAVRVISRVRQVLGAEVGIADLFERPVLADFARGVRDAARAELPPIQPVPRTAPLPLSFAQQRLWFLERMGELGGTYHIPTRLRLGGELDRAALRRALDAMLARHEALRTTFVEVEGEPVQRIAPAGGFRLVEHDLAGHPDPAAELYRLAADEADAPFDLEQGPLIRGRLVRLAEDDHVLLLTMHHIVSDGWSMEVLTRELGTLYDAFRRGEENPLPPLPIQYADYAAWQRQWVGGEVLREQTAYWKGVLTGAPELLELPADHPRPARQSHAGAVAGVELDEAVTAGLKALGRRHGTTLFMTVLAGWAAVLARLSGQPDVVVGTPSANRGRAEIEGLIGFFVNTLALRVDLAGSPSVAELLGQVRERVLGAQQNQDIPFEQVVELVQPVRSLAHTPLFQVMFAWQSASEGRPELPGRRAGGVAGPSALQAAAKFDLSLTLGEAGGRIAGSVTYATSLFEQATVERYLAYLHRVLAAMAADDLQGVDALPLLPEAERRLVVEEWNATGAAYPSEPCIHELVEAQAARAPDAVAVAFDGGELTYGELNAHANRLAHHLRGLGVGPDARVAICVERGPAMVVGLLAILKAGGGYVPLDPSYPAERLRYMLHDSAPAAVLTQGSLEGVEALFAGANVPVIDLEGAEWADRP
ncbi:MAG TPA: amino acid adenylation domain-containing protein, partial [Longimicrobium sp.]